MVRKTLKKSQDNNSASSESNCLSSSQDTSTSNAKECKIKLKKTKTGSPVEKNLFKAKKHTIRKVLSTIEDPKINTFKIHEKANRTGSLMVRREENVDNHLVCIYCKKTFGRISHLTEHHTYYRGRCRGQKKMEKVDG